MQHYKQSNDTSVEVEFCYVYRYTVDEKQRISAMHVTFQRTVMLVALKRLRAQVSHSENISLCHTAQRHT
jgi:hypothetical protein